MSEHRYPPKTPWTGRVVGTCRWCRKTDVPKPLRYWHTECADVWMIASSPNHARIRLWQTAPHRCADCRRSMAGLYGPPTRWRRYYDDPVGYRRFPWLPAWDLDHIVPLWSVDRDDPDAMRFWSLDNMQILCKPCHKAKTAREAAQRGKENRIRKAVADPVQPLLEPEWLTGKPARRT